MGEAHGELGDSGWKDVRLNLLELFRKDVGDPGNFQLSALKVAVELGFTTSLTFPLPVAYSRNFGLRRANPVKVLLSDGRWRELPDRTELVISVTDAGDVDASKLAVMLIPSLEIIVVSEKTMFERNVLNLQTRRVLENRPGFSMSKPPPCIGRIDREWLNTCLDLDYPGLLAVRRRGFDPLHG